MRLSVFLSSEEVGTTHRNALRVLAETGTLVEHEGMLGRLEALGGHVGPRVLTAWDSGATLSNTHRISFEEG